MGDERIHRAALNLLIHGPGTPTLPGIGAAGARDICRQMRGWRSAPQIHGFGLAKRTVHGKKTRDRALKVYVTRKAAKSRLDVDLVPPFIEVVDWGTRIPIDVEQQAPFRLHAGATGVTSGGSRISRVGGKPGTLGCLVRRRGVPGDLYILSNSHVLAFSGPALAQVGDPIQLLGTGGGQQIAELASWTTLQAGIGFPNLSDAAIARVDPSVSVDASIEGLGTPAITSAFVNEGMNVQLRGAGTPSIVEGRVRDPLYSIRLTYRIPGRVNQEYGFFHQVLIEPRFEGSSLTDFGDSGALVLNERKSVLGLHFAGSSKLAVFNRIEHVFKQLDIELAT